MTFELRLSSNGHCGTQGTAERIKRIYAMPADMPPQARQAPDPLPIAKRPGTSGVGLQLEPQMSRSQTAPSLKFPSLDATRTKQNLKHNRLFDVPFPQLLFKERCFEREAL